MSSPAFPHFARYLLRTTDTSAAAAFYAAVLGRALPVYDTPRGDGIVALHEAARARGARPHWLGHITAHALGGAEAAAARAVAAGATRLGPPPGTGDFAVLRDPDGSIVAFTDRTDEPTAGVVWHQLNARRATDAASWYGTQVGWSFGAPEDLEALGVHRRFAYRAGTTPVGVLSDIAQRPEVHTHWLFYFAVPALDAAVAQVQARRGIVTATITLASGARLAVCDDPQGAAFGLIEPGDLSRLAGAGG